MSRSRRSSATWSSGRNRPGAGRVLDRQVVAEEAVVAVERGRRPGSSPGTTPGRASWSCRRTWPSSTRPARSPTPARSPSTSQHGRAASRCRADSDRSPCGDRNSSGSSSVASIRRSRSVPDDASSRLRCPVCPRSSPASSSRCCSAGRGGAGTGRTRLVTESVLPRPLLARRRRPPASGSPDHRAHLDRHRPVGGAEAVVEEAVVVVPQVRRRRARRGSPRSARGTSARGRRRAGGRSGAGSRRSSPSPPRRPPSSPCRRTAPAPRRPAGASGRSGRCCPGPGTRPRTGSRRWHPRGSPTR